MSPTFYWLDGEKMVCLQLFQREWTASACGACVRVGVKWSMYVREGLCSHTGTCRYEVCRLRGGCVHSHSRRMAKCNHTCHRLCGWVFDIPFEGGPSFWATLAITSMDTFFLLHPLPSENPSNPSHRLPLVKQPWKTPKSFISPFVFQTLDWFMLLSMEWSDYMRSIISLQTLKQEPCSRVATSGLGQDSKTMLSPTRRGLCSTTTAMPTGRRFYPRFSWAVSRWWNGDNGYEMVTMVMKCSSMIAFHQNTK